MSSKKSNPLATASEFHAELNMPGIMPGIHVYTRPRLQLVAPGRERKARIHDAFGVVLLWLAAALIGCAVLLASTGTAKADSADALAYAAEYGDAVCIVLDDYPTYSGLIGISQAIVQQTGMTYRDAGEAIYDSVSELCPEHMGLLLRFATRYVPRSSVA